MTKEKKAKGRPIGYGNSTYEKARMEIEKFEECRKAPKTPALMRSARCSSGMRFGVAK